ncbi:MAG: undecaprenyl-diphosphate phosphatase [Methylacidiphilales bacterium]|nr:undecaprenyl-diphosphate phosphatase [Candidatus Methylacidiphilales bacterium]
MTDTFFSYTVLAMVQGLCEFLPISSSAHLVLMSMWLEMHEHSLTVDVALHFGSLIAIILYYRNELIQLRGNPHLLRMLGLAFLPTLITAPFIAESMELFGRNTISIAVMLIVFAVVLYLATRRHGVSGLESITVPMALSIGAAQLLAFFPGVSRSGVTISASLFWGIKKESAIYFSFLLAIPTIAGVTAYQFFQVIRKGEQLDIPLIGYTVVVSALVSYFALHALVTIVRRIGFLPFVIYRILLGAILLTYATI